MKKISKLLFCLTVLLAAVCSIHAQNAAKNWVFGNRARIDFNGPLPVATALPGSVAFTPSEGSASISDPSGNLLFYTNGIRVWNRDNQVMPNGTGLLGHDSSTQTALIVPCSCSKYYIFTTNTYSSGTGVKYSVVDMSLDNGMGDVVMLQKNLPLFAPAAEKLAAVADGNGGFWFLSHDIRLTTQPGNEFYAYHLLPGSSDCTITGGPVRSQIGTTYATGPTVGSNYRFAPGQMKISPDGKLLAVAGFDATTNVNDPPSERSFIELFKFDTATGIVSALGGTVHRVNLTKRSYGIEFSPSSEFLYAVTHISKKNFIYRYRYDSTGNTFSPDGQYEILLTKQLTGSLQLAPDGNIYLAFYPNQFLGLIRNPDLSDHITVPFETFPLPSGSSSTYGLPAMVAGDFACNSTPPVTGCSCDQVAPAPFWTPDLSLAWKSFGIYNVKTPASPICSIDVDLRDSSTNPPQNPWAGGGLKVNGIAAPWSSPYTRVPSGSGTISGNPSINSAAVNFNIGLDYTIPFTGKFKFIFHHCDGTTCEWNSDNWTPEPPPQITMRVREKYLGDLRGEFLPLTIGLSGGMGAGRNAKWIAVEPIDPGTEVFSVAGDAEIDEQLFADSPALITASARKQDRAALYELVKPVDLGRFNAGEIRLVLKRQAGNPVKPRLRFLFFDENANMIGFATNDKW